MVNQLERLLLAATISLASLSFSYYWYSKGKSSFEDKILSEPIARLNSNTNEVHRKRAKRVIWQAINRGEDLYEREAVRTMAGATAEIFFIDSETTIQLEPDSVIILEKSEGNVALNFLKGNIFVTSTGKEDTTKPGLAIKAGKKTIQAGGSEINLSKTQEKDDIELQVFKGKATVEGESGETVELNQNESGTLSENKKMDVEKNLEVTFPQSNENLFVDVSKQESVRFAWKKLDPGYKMSLYIGKSPTKLELFEDISVQNDQGQLYANLKSGKYYWRLEASSEDPNQGKVKSAVYKNKVIPIREPIIISPKRKERIALKKNKADYVFEWTNPMALEKMQLQIWRTQKGKIIEGSEETIQVTERNYTYNFKNKGIYAARVTGFLDKGNEKVPVSSNTRKFLVRLADELAPPELELPAHQEYLSHSKIIESGIFLTWTKSPTAAKYQLLLTSPGKEPEKIEVYDESYRFQDAKPGKYKWAVASISKDDKVSKYTEEREFIVEDVPRLAWKIDKEQEESYYFGDQPKLDLAWQPLAAKYITYKVSYAYENNWQDSSFKTTTEDHIILDVAEDGYYGAQVQALNAKGKVMAQSTRKRVKVSEFPFLPPPEFSENLPSLVKADPRGNITLTWKAVNGAKSYLIRIRDNDKKVVKELKVSGTSTQISALLPGKYRVFIYTEDQYGRVSKKSDRRLVAVDKKSDIRAPSGFKGIKIKGIKFK